MMRFVLVVVLALALIPLLAEAWGQDGHKIVGQIAADRLSSMTAKWIAYYLGSTKTMADVAPLPDNYDNSKAGRWSFPYHFSNVPRDAVQWLPSYCPDPPACVVAAILNFTHQQFEEGKAGEKCNYTSGVQPCNVEFLVHFVGDCHQPLHVSYADDAGGNLVKVEFYGASTELHKVWDDLIIQKFMKDSLNGGIWSDYASYLEQMITPSLADQYASVTDPTVWANESYTYTRTVVYDFGNGTQPSEDPSIDDWYYERNLPLIHQRLIAGGVRLATLFENIFTSLQKTALEHQNKFVVV